MNKVFPFTTLLLALPLAAQLRLTEVMSDSNHSDSNANGDWFEITNTGNTAVDLAGFSFDDDSETAGASGPLPAFSLAAGASMIVLNEEVSLPFRELWDLPDDVRVVTSLEITDFPGLSSNGDAVNLYDAAGTLVDSFTFGPVIDGGLSFARFTDGQEISGQFSFPDFLGAYRSNDPSEDVGSPGISQDLPGPLPPIFTEPFSSAGVVNMEVGNFAFRVLSIDPNPTELVNISATGTPPWLSVNNLGGGVASFSGIPPASAVGSHEFLVTATDSSGLSSSQTYRLDIVSANSPIILNEYNAVSEDRFLGGGAQDEIDGSTDPFFGRIAGNGGPWVEFAITQTSDLRNWTLEISNDDSTRTLRLSDHIALSAIPAGTILTFTESNQLVPTTLNQTSLLNTLGYTWSNIWMHDPLLIDQENSTHPDTPAINSSNTRFTWRNGADQIIYGPSGESVALSDSDGNGTGDTLVSVGSSEVFRLEASTDSSISPLNANYDDGGSSTFGSPNIWSAGTMTQSFAASLVANTPPSFGPISTSKAVRGEYSVEITHSGAPVTVITAPPFVDITLTPGTIMINNNRPLTPADIGNHEISLSADNGAVNFLVYELQVVHPSPPLILNEYNAVAPDRFLNGGTLAADSDAGPASADSHFGRVLGNGGNWFELVLLGDGQSGVTDLTGWTIELGQIASSGIFVPNSTVTLSDPATWSAVSHGTILTFIDQNTAGGGLDTQINRVNELTTNGFAWTNIHLGTPGSVTSTGLSELDINSSNTAFIIRNSSGTPIFGPAGEGVAPLSGVGSEEIFELENDPRLSVSACDVASDTALGFDDGSSSSTFGSPNLFAPIGSVADRAQDFSIFVPSLIQSYFASIGIPNADPAADADGDGVSNLEEYLFGGDAVDPSFFPLAFLNASSTPGPVFLSSLVRVNDPNFVITAERSTNLIDWVTDDLEVFDEAIPDDSEFVDRVVTFQRTAGDPRMFFRFVFSEL